MVDVAVLASVPLFRDLPADQLAALAGCVARHRYGRGAAVFRTGEPADAFYVVLSGRAKVLLANEKGHEVTLSIVGPHDSFGEIGLLDDLPRSASVVTLEPCEMLHMDKADFTRCLSSSFELTMRIMRGLVRRLHQADRQIESLALMSVRDRVACVLHDLAKPVDGKFVILRAPSKIEIARMIGASREMVSRTITDMRISGKIWVEKHRIVFREGLSTRRGSQNV